MTDRPRVPRSGWLALGAVAAALAVGGGSQPTVITALVAFVLAIGSTIVRRFARNRAGARRVARSTLPLAVGALLLLGRATLSEAAPAADPSAPGTSGEAFEPALEGPGQRVAIVDSVGSPKAAEQIAILRLEVEADGSGRQVQVEALLPRYPEIGPGDRIAVRGSIQAPGDDDFGAYLRRIGAVGLLRSPTLDLLAGPVGPQGLLDRLRRGSAEVMARALPEPQAGLADGILIGLRERVDRDLAAAFTTAGVSHIVAISGWNIAIVAALVAALLGARVGPRARIVITLTAIVGYTLVAGASPSVNRAAVMAAIGLTARAGGRSGPAMAALGWAVLILLLVDPSTVSDPGFELSGLATAGLIGWAAPLTDRLRRVRGHALPEWLAESLAISLAAEASTLPLVLLIFGRLALVGPIANLAVVPLVPPAMAAGAVALGAGWLGAIGLPQPLVTVLGLPAWATLGLLIALVRAAASLPLASVILPPPWNIAAAGTAAAVVGLAIGGRGALRQLETASVRVE
jgi:competence protein ComEC